MRTQTHKIRTHESRLENARCSCRTRVCQHMPNVTQHIRHLSRVPLGFTALLHIPRETEKERSREKEIPRARETETRKAGQQLGCLRKLVRQRLCINQCSGRTSSSTIFSSLGCSKGLLQVRALTVKCSHAQPNPPKHQIMRIVSAALPRVS